MEERTKYTSDLPIIVGDMTMEIYTSSEYVTRDIDNVIFSIYLIASNPYDIDFQQIKDDLKASYEKVLEAFE